MATVTVELSVSHLPKDSFWRKAIEKATEENMTPLEFAHYISGERGTSYVYIPSTHYYHSP